MKILIAEDSRAMRQIIARTLRRAGHGSHHLIEAADGTDALHLTRTEQPDLILSGWNMPHMSGIDLLGTLREDGNTTPFGFITAEHTQEARDRATAAGAQFFIRKPFTADDLADALDPLM